MGVYLSFTKKRPVNLEGFIVELGSDRAIFKRDIFIHRPNFMMRFKSLITFASFFVKTAPDCCTLLIITYLLSGIQFYIYNLINTTLE